MSPTVVEVLLCLWWAAIGLSLATLLDRPRSLLGRCLVAFPLGVAVYVIAGWALALVEAFSPVRALLVCSVVVAGAALVKRRDWSVPDVATLVWAALYLLAVAAASVSFQALGSAQLTPDSLRYIQGGTILGLTGGWREIPPDHLLSRQVFVGLVNAPAGERFYVASVFPLFGVSGTALLAWAASDGLQRLRVPVGWTVTLVAASVAALLSTDRVIYHFFYVNSHMAVAVYTLLVVFAGWSATVERDLRWSLLAVPAVGAMMLARPESPLYVALLVLPIVVSSRVPPAGRVAVAGSHAFFACAWFGGVLRTTLDVDGWAPLEPINAATLAGLGVLAVTALAARGRAAPVVRALPAVGVAVAAVGVTAALFFVDALISDVVTPTVTNLLGEGLWGLAWLPLGCLFVLVAVFGNMPHRSNFLVPLVGFVPLVFILGVTRGDAYRVGPGDSLNRMLLHVMLTLVVFLVLGAAGRLSRPRPRREGGMSDPLVGARAPSDPPSTCPPPSPSVNDERATSDDPTPADRPVGENKRSASRPIGGNKRSADRP